MTQVQARISLRAWSVITAIVLALGVVAAAAMPGQAGPTVPTDKMVVAGSRAQVAAPGTAVTLLQAKMQTSTTEDLMLHVSLECTIVTDISTQGNDNSSAEGHVEVWIEVDGQPVPVLDPDPDGGRITFCDRSYNRTTSNFVADNNATIKDGLRTVSAHAFNWVKLNTGNGIHTITVKGTLSSSASSNAHAEAVIAGRTLVVDPTHAAVNETNN